MTPPDYLWYQHEHPLSVLFRWSAREIDPSTRSWRLYNTVAGVPSLLREVPVAEMEADVLVGLGALGDVVVRAVDGQGMESADSPRLSFVVAGGPDIVLESWNIGTREASIGWRITSQTFLKQVSWTIGNGTLSLSGQGQSSDHARISVAGLVGSVRLDLVASDVHDRSTHIQSSAAVWNGSPGTPTLQIVEIGMHFIRIQAIPDPEGLTPTTLIRFNGNDTSTDEPSPFIHTFLDLPADTPMTIRCQAINAGGVLGPSSIPFLVRTLVDPDSVPLAASGSLLVQLLTMLTPALRSYILGLYSSTRIRAPGMSQILLPPTGFDALYELFIVLAPRLGDILRRDWIDAHRLATLVDLTPDPLMKLSLLCEWLEYGDIWAA